MNRVLVTQVIIALVTSVVATVTAELILDSWREARARAPLPRPAAPGIDQV